MKNEQIPKRNAVKFALGILFMCLGVLCLLLRMAERPHFGVINESILIDVPVEELPENTLYISYERRQYERGKMTLLIPAIDVFTPIGESTEPQLLTQMPGLYEFSALPGEGNNNTSIAGHRDIYDMAFYSLDKLQQGDYLYLLHEGFVYQYEYLDTAVIKPNDWSVILPQGFSCLTLTTCDPIGTSWNRLVVTGRLLTVKELSETYEFLASER